MKAIRIFAQYSLLVLGAGVLWSCATNRTQIKPWMKGNQKIGTIETSPRSWGTESRYKDLQGRLLRTEERNRDGQLRAGVCATEFSYAGNDLVMQKNLDTNEQLTCNQQGYAMCRWTYSQEKDGDHVVEESFFNAKELPVRTRDGFAILRNTEAPNGQLEKIQFFDPHRKPAPSAWLGVTNVVEVQYAYLQGVTPVTCAAFLDRSGKVIERKQLSGMTEGSWGSSYTTYNYYYYYYYQPRYSYHR